MDKLENRLKLICSGNFKLMDNVCIYKHYKVNCTYQDHLICVKKLGNPEVEVLIYGIK